ncbi:MAG: class I SAM-dependent methyltransferase [Planctomycetes bacterium]|nr:class I SAM-dependent methyltransferase [Planctomycetota bacterium]
MLQIDIGCGSRKRRGCFGIDIERHENVDAVADLTREPLPLADNSVDAAFSSHFLEHIQYPEHVLREIVRVCKPGASVEIWTPYQKHSGAFMAGHISYFNEMRWSHFCIEYPDLWFPIDGVLRIEQFHYGIGRNTLQMLSNVPLHFAIRFFSDVVYELGVRATVLKGEHYRNKSEYKKTLVLPDLVFGSSRSEAVRLDAPPEFWRPEV